MEWLQMIRDHIASSFHIEKDDFDLAGSRGHTHDLAFRPFGAGGRSRSDF